MWSSRDVYLVHERGKQSIASCSSSFPFFNDLVRNCASLVLLTISREPSVSVGMRHTVDTTPLCARISSHQPQAEFLFLLKNIDIHTSIHMYCMCTLIRFRQSFGQIKKADGRPKKNVTSTDSIKEEGAGSQTSSRYTYLCTTP